jgi:hypothetical protein
MFELNIIHMKLKLMLFTAFGIGLSIGAHGQISFQSQYYIDYRELALPGMTAAVEAQFGSVSLGFEVAPPKGGAGTLGYGGYWGYEQSLGEKFGITLQSGFTKLGISDSAARFIDKSSMLPVQLGVKYFFNKRGTGIYTHLSGGAHYMLFTSEGFFTDEVGTVIRVNRGFGERFSEIYLSGSFALGYVFNNKIDLGLRYNFVAPDSKVEGSTASHYLGFRLGYRFGRSE